MTQEDVEQLMKPRYKVMADYPYNPWLIGETLFVSDKGELFGQETGYVDYAFVIMESEVSKYLHLFKKLEWWEERKEDEMPQYVKLNESSLVHKVEKWSGTNASSQPLFEYINRVGFQTTACVLYFLPATRAEYEAYHQQTQIK